MKPEDDTDQLTLDPILEELKLSGVGELPGGVGELSKKQLRFLTGLVAHGQKAKAALDAGYGANLASAAVQASRLLKKVTIQRVYQQCLDALAKDADQLVKRVCERSVMLHDQFREASQRRSELKELILLSQKEEIGGEDGGKTTIEYETELSRTLKLEKHYAGLCNQTDQLLASLLGKLNVHISGSVDHNHTHKGETVVVPAAALDAFAAMRQEHYAETGRGGRN